ncbi:MAG TPA: SDR family NAD(P)-dependent oxidoreductase [Solirubrobacteraceae bacterium]|jgi:NAD(P)-dependent dehydrogenase (short-subunit alcohol dehydrogenase family)
MSTVWLVTGSSRGLGRHIVEAALERGDRVLATARRPEALADVVAAHGDRLVTIAHDVAVPAQANAAVQAATGAFGRLDVVVNNAGYAELASVEDMSEQAFRDQIEVDFFGTVHTTRAALPILREQGRGHIINVASVGSRMATPGLSAYQSAKWATAGFSLVLAAEVAPLGIRVTSLEPGGMATDWAGSSMAVPEISEPYQPTVGAAAAMHDASWRPLGDPAKIAQVILDLAAMDEPPTRLLLGSEAYAYATAAARAQLASDEHWRDLSQSTDRDDATATERDPLGTGSVAAV